jgi:hypothetical protein
MHKAGFFVGGILNVEASNNYDLLDALDTHTYIG